MVNAPMSHQCGLVSNPSINAKMWVEFFLVFSLANLSLGSPVFPLQDFQILFDLECMDTL